jgi:hypothetical protein
MFEVTIRASFDDMPVLATFFATLAQSGGKFRSVETETDEPQGSVAQPMTGGQLQAATAPALGPFGGGQEPPRRGRKPGGNSKERYQNAAQATSAVLDQPQPIVQQGPFGNGAPQPQPAAPAAAFGTPVLVQQAPVTVEMLQAKVSEVIAKSGDVTAVAGVLGNRPAAQVPEAERAAVYGKLQQLLTL